MGPSTELRFTAPIITGTQLLLPDRGPVLAILRPASNSNSTAHLAVSNWRAIMSFSFPTGAPRISSHGYDPSFQLPWSRPCSNWTAAGMLSVYVPTQNGSHRVVGESFRQAGRLRHLLLRGSNSICMRESGFPQPPRTTLLESATRFALEWPDGNLQAASHGTRSAHARQSAARRTLRAPASTRKAPQMPGECCIRKDKAVRVLCSVFIRASLQFSKSGFRFEADRRIIE